MSNCLVEFTSELLNTVANTVEVPAKANNLPNRSRGFLNLGVIHTAEPQLLSMERGSIRAMNG